MSNAVVGNESEALRRLWAEYRLAAIAGIEIMDREGTGPVALAQIIQAGERASRAIRIIQEVLARKDVQREAAISLTFLDLPHPELTGLALQGNPV